jgi:hypothetical protein
MENHERNREFGATLPFSVADQTASPSTHHNKGNALSNRNTGRDTLVGTFYSSRKRPAFAIEQLKTLRSYKQAKRVIEQVSLYGLNHEIYGKLRADRWDALSPRPRFVKSTDWIQEVGWIAHSIRASAEQLNTFIATRREFGKAYMLGDYPKANELLRLIETNHGLSFWLAERQLMLHQAQGGFEQHKKHLTSIHNELSDSLISYLITVSSNRLEPHVTPDAFYKSVDTAVAGLKNGEHRWLAALIEFQVSPWTSDWLANTHDLLRWCGERPLIDRYNSLIKLLSYASSPSMRQDQRVELINILSDLQPLIIDPQLEHIKWAVQERADNSPFNEHNELYLTALDAFVCGRFTECVSRSESLLEEDPTSFDTYWLLARATACAPETTAVKLDGKSLAFQILKALQEIASNYLDLNVFLMGLKSIALRLGDNHLGISLWQFAEREFSGNINELACRYAAIANKLHSPESIAPLNTGYVRECLRHLEITHPNHPSVSLSLFRGGYLDTTTELPPTIAPPLAELAHAEQASASGHHADVLMHVARMSDFKTDADIKQSSYYAGDAARLEFEAFRALRQPEHAAATVLKYYLINPNTLRHVAFDTLIEEAKAGMWEQLRKTVYWPCLIFLNNGDEQDIYEAADDFLASQGMANPFPLLEAHLPSAAERVLLREVLVPKVLARGALWKRTPGEERELHTSILRRLYTVSTDDQPFVIQKLSEVEQAKILEDAYRGIEGPKFFIDSPDTNRAMASLMEGSFERYRLYKEYEDKGGQLTADSAFLELAKAGASTKTAQDWRTESSSVLLSNMATTVFTEYLFSSSRGLNATLATRVRHGGLENQLKRIFGAACLLATKDLSDVYQCDKLVLSLLESTGTDERGFVTAAYVRFTIELNTIYDDLISQSLRIRLPPATATFFEQAGIPAKELGTTGGLLDFSNLFTEEVVTQLEICGPRTVNSLIAELHKMFSVQAQEAFDAVRAYLGSTIARQIDNALKQLDDTVALHIADEFSRAALRKSISSAKEGFPHDLRIIQNWFYLASKIDTGIETIRKMAATAGRVIDFASNGKLGRIVEGNVHDELIRAEDGVVLYDVLSILMRNVVQHSGVVHEQELIYDYVVLNGDRRRLVVSSKMPDPDSCYMAVTKAQRRMAEPIDPRALDRSPGGTGLARARALLAQIRTRGVDISITCDSRQSRFVVSIEY